YVTYASFGLASTTLRLENSTLSRRTSLPDNCSSDDSLCRPNDCASSPAFSSLYAFPTALSISANASNFSIPLSGANTSYSIYWFYNLLLSRDLKFDECCIIAYMYYTYH